jgi:protein-disulfide isomerase
VPPPRQKTVPPESRRARRESQREARREARDRDVARRRVAEQRRISPVVWLSGAAVVLALLVVGVLFVANQHPPAAELIPPGTSSPVALADGKTLGASGAPVTIDLWADFQCPFCGQFSQQTEPQLVSTYVATGKAKLVFHDFAFVGQESVDAAVAATCAEQQGKFWPFHDYLYANQGAVENEGAFAPARLLQVAVAVGLDQATYSSCISNAATLQQVTQEHQQGIGAGVTGTPTIFINSQAQSAYDLASLSAAIDKAYGNATPAPLPSGAATPSSSLAASPSS